jgi:pimeloyl-ACP methyl ester carboxylesterase
MVESNNLNQTIELKDGRSLGYAEFGDLNGIPLFHFHGHPGSRLEGKFFMEIPEKLGFHAVCVDRPGIGLSDFKPNRILLDWPTDILELADHLGFDKFIVEGISGGGPYALVCAYKIPEKIQCCGVVAGVGPMSMAKEGMMKSNRLNVFLARWAPLILKIMYHYERKALNDPEKARKLIIKLSEKLPGPDKLLLQDPNLMEIFLEDTKEAFRSGLDGVMQDEKIYSRSWGFSLEEISPELQVYLWQGELDVNVPVSMGRQMSKLIPKCKAFFFPNEAHLSVAFNHLEEILKIMKS